MPKMTIEGESTEDNEPDWKQHFGEDSSSGYTCDICHALVPRYPHHAIAHLEWHEQNDGH